MFEIQLLGITKNGINAGCTDPREFSSKFDALKYLFKRRASFKAWEFRSGKHSIFSIIDDFFRIPIFWNIKII